jgi:ATP-dependent helicase YprA (DUF1998 family)
MSNTNIGLSTPSEKAVWISGAYIIQRLAASLLDVSEDELQVGIYSTQSLSTGKNFGGLYLADALDNGSGYSKWIFDNLDELTKAFIQYRRKLVEHQDMCDSACYQCLKQYSNRVWHPILDWKLGISLLDYVLLGQINDAALDAEVKDIIDEFCSKYSEVSINPSNPSKIRVGEKEMQITHPMFYSSKHNTITKTTFDLVRSPYNVILDLRQS